MSNHTLKEGQVVLCIKDTCTHGRLKQGCKYRITRVLVGSRIMVEGSPIGYQHTRFKAVDELPRVDTLTFLEVSNAIRNRKALEYYNEHKNEWLKVKHPEHLTFQCMNEWMFRTVVDTHDVNGMQVPRPTIRPVHFDEKGIAYGISFNKREVFKAPIKQFSGVPYWTKPEDAHKALVAMLLPYGIQAKPLAERLLND